MKQLLLCAPLLLVVCLARTGSCATTKDPCKGPPQVCEYNAACSVDEKGEPVCSCRSVCTKELRWVCGSDGKSYQNPCLLQNNACQRRRRISIVSYGKCKASKRCKSRTTGKPASTTTARPEPSTEQTLALKLSTVRTTLWPSRPPPPTDATVAVEEEDYEELKPEAGPPSELEEADAAEEEEEEEEESAGEAR